MPKRIPKRPPSGTHTATAPFRPSLGICALLALLVLAAYGQVLHHDFVVFDDVRYILDNPHVRPGLRTDGLWWAFSFNDEDYWLPVTWISHMIDCQVYGLNPAGHHATSLFIHLANSALLFLLLTRATGALGRSAVVAAAFALHPLNVDSVAWIAERKSLLSTLFWMLGLYSYVAYTETKSLGRYGLTFLLFGLGLMSKPMVVTFPFVLLLLDYWPLGRWDTGPPPCPAEKGGVCRPAWRRLVLEKLPFFLLTGASLAASTFSVQVGGVMAEMTTVPFRLRLANALISYIQYLRKAIWPVDLAVYYPFPHHIPPWQIGAALAAIFTLSVLAIRSRRSHPYLGVGWFWFLGTLVPVIGLVQINLWPAMADRFAYIPLIGLFIALAWGGHEVAATPKGKVVAAGMAAAAILAAGTVTRHQTGYWKNQLTLFAHAHKVTQDNVLTRNNLGVALDRAGRHREAIAHFKAALAIDPNNPWTHLNMGLALSRLERPAKAAEWYRKALVLDPTLAQAHNNLGVALIRQDDLRNARRHFQAALKLDPGYKSPRMNLQKISSSATPPPP